ncbi:MAG: ComF family protein, partial [Vicinamibacterales bacterium]
MIARAIEGVVGVLVAPECAACGGVLEAPCEGPVCAACWRAVHPVAAPFCGICGDPLRSWRVLTVADGLCARCRRVPPSFSVARSAGSYEGALRDIIHAFKYDARRTLAAPLAALMRDRAADLLRDADLVVPVPLHVWRRLRRGFNQAEDLAKRLGVPMCRALRRTRATL